MSRLTVQPDDAAARCSTYGLLARLWLREVDADLLRGLRSSPLCDAFMAAGGVLPAGDLQAAVEQLEVDYCQLFLGPSKHLPPYQSVWQAGQFNGKPTDSMRQFMDICGYDLSRLPPSLMLDHLGVQLDVMGHILSHFATWPSNTDSRSDLDELTNSFFATHLRWPARLLPTARQQASTDFYRSVIALTADFLKSEAEEEALPSL